MIEELNTCVDKCKKATSLSVYCTKLDNNPGFKITIRVPYIRYLLIVTSYTYLILYPILVEWVKTDKGNDICSFLVHTASKTAAMIPP
jgi:hypothetical protein